MNELAAIVIVSGSPTLTSRLHGMTRYCAEQLANRGHDIETIYAAELPPEDLLRANFASPAVQQALALVEKADAVVLASPVYQASYTGLLKTFLDLVPQKGFRQKIVFPLFVGGTIAHLLAIDYALKPVVAALGGTRMLNGVYGVDQWITRLDEGRFSLADELKQRLDDAIDELDEELKWMDARKKEGPQE